MQSSAESGPPWMNCGYIPSDWTDAQVIDVVDDMIIDGPASKKYKGACATLAATMYAAAPPVKDLEDTAPPSVLDCGCGYGAQSVLFKKLYPTAHYTGLNISSTQIEGAKQ